MEIIAHKCLEGFHRRFIEADSKPELHRLNAFEVMMQGNYSGESLIAKIIDTDEHWEGMLNTKGFGRGVKYDKAQTYREELIITWNTIKKTFETANEAEISKLMGLFLWNMEEEEFTHSYLGVIEEAIKQNKLWKSPAGSDIFCSLFGFMQGASKTLEEIANEYNLERERVRQLKVQYHSSFKQDFWFLKDELIIEKLKSLFDPESHTLEQISEQTERVNSAEGVHFTREFYTCILSIAFDMVLIGDISDIKIQRKRSSKGNVWNNLYLQTKPENERCNLEGLINALAIEMHNPNYHFEQDKVVDISSYAPLLLTDHEVEYYNTIIAAELEVQTELKQDRAVIKRNSHVTQPEMVEAALFELGGFAYADDILEKVVEIHPEKDWSMPVLRASSKGDNFYSVGKSGLFGLKNVKAEMGNGTLNDVIHIYMSRKDSPIHILELLEHINNLFPRPKTLRTIHTILEQNSKGYFQRFEGGFYGLTERVYESTEFPGIVGGHGMYLRQIIEGANGLNFEDIFQIFNERYGHLEIQVRYLLGQMIETHRSSLIDGLYYRYVAPLIPETEENDKSETSAEEIDVEIDQEELDFEELDQPNLPDDLINDAVAQIKVRRGQPKFRQRLLSFYKRTCIVTGCKIPDLLEAAHVLPHSQKKDFNLSNGLLLRADIHTLFDLGMIAIEPESMKLKLNESLMESGEYADLNNINIGSKLTELHPAFKINKEGLNWRWKSFIESE